MVEGSRLLPTFMMAILDGLRIELNFAKSAVVAVRVNEGELKLVQVIGIEVLTS